MTSHVSEIDAAPSEKAFAHFSNRLSYETDCWDVFDSSRDGSKDYVLLDVRNAQAYAKGHLPGAISLPRRELDEGRLADFSPDTLFVVYCAGPHCNGANKAAVRLAQLGRPVKEMIGGVTGWLDEGFLLEMGGGQDSIHDFPDSEPETEGRTLG